MFETFFVTQSKVLEKSWRQCHTLYTRAKLNERMYFHLKKLTRKLVSFVIAPNWTDASSPLLNAIKSLSQNERYRSTRWTLDFLRYNEQNCTYQRTKEQNTVNNKLCLDCTLSFYSARRWSKWSLIRFPITRCFISMKIKKMISVINVMTNYATMHDKCT